ncbi:Arginine permease [Komagataella phaffii CBS 7435]|uniref:Plasma membrane arginine permease, requires phosphatidyl ethanolamine (PE) for localization n=2 Tax=Komagataella phaffii TaxID=460519 RepID=C4QYY6_KOMPG|nr:Plasma membrane arginine permease, requires phosphatidyl ethanolamine (PE) for localization [Komagataella phaffii GS115]AOA61020.1 GQ67_01539T0 [Komagataella phaffii]CAH2447286.1 Arginine permease [Komagataella phaffii CBS 7435]AOA66455.1 GQ68_01555T0 [Komagataella phaffii GS115]CAY68460.1 Plasma membrane arginine permease, requires phosphatidyl ethanolamine (PE) for localization [Komagataella phaffii GS115]CCA37525.1 Arginine permease [Komagataella phaffii CBS 7435]
MVNHGEIFESDDTLQTENFSKTKSNGFKDETYELEDWQRNNPHLNIEKGDLKETELKRNLKPRHVSMIALGGTIGTGLFIGTATPLQIAGPVNALIAYIFMGSLAYSVTQSLGEMATYTPISGSFCVFNTRYISKAVGFATSWLYWWNWSTTFAIELSIIGQIIQYWTDAVPLWAWILIFYFVLVAANFVPVQYYGEVEFWIASIKVIAIMGFIVYALCIVCGAGRTGPIGFRYWRNPGPWGPGILVANKNTGRFLGWLSSLVNAAFTYQGVELTGVSAGETSNPRKTVPRAINKVIFRILIFYVATLFFLGLLVPYNDPELSSDTSYIASSPFVIAIKNAGTPVLPHIFNAVILTTVISAGNSNVYVGSRVMYSMSTAGIAPKFFSWTTTWGIPYLSVMATSLIGLLAFLNVDQDGKTVFEWLVNISAVSGLIAWVFISVAHLRFMKALEWRGVSRDELPYKAKYMPWFAWYAAIAITIITFIQGYDSFFDFNASDFFTAYISLILFFALWIGALVWYREPIMRSVADIDLDTDRKEIDMLIWEEQEPTNIWEKFWGIVA